MSIEKWILGATLTLVVFTANVASHGAPKGASKTGETPAEPAADGLTETPALPYLTLMLVRDPAVQKELNLTAGEVEAVAKAVAEIDSPMWLLRDVPVARCREQLDKYLAQLRSRLSKSVGVEQLARLDEITTQARGYKGLLSADLTQRLTLSAGQSTKLRDVIAAAVRPSDARPATDERQSVARVLEILTGSQSEQWTSMLGKPFELTQVRQIACVAPEFQGVDAWINSDPLTIASQRGKVVAIHFWAFGCINCVHNLPHYQAWFESFSPSKVTIVGIHTPETDREKSVDDLRANIRERQIEYPVAVDAAAENWKAWGNNMWPSVYLIDKRGQVRNWWYGELNWQGATGEAFMRKRIEALAAED